MSLSHLLKPGRKPAVFQQNDPDNTLMHELTRREAHIQKIGKPISLRNTWCRNDVERVKVLFQTRWWLTERKKSNSSVQGWPLMQTEDTNQLLESSSLLQICWCQQLVIKTTLSSWEELVTSDDRTTHPLHSKHRTMNYKLCTIKIILWDRQLKYIDTLLCRNNSHKLRITYDGT